MNSSIIISGVSYSAKNLKKFKEEITPELYAFLINWFDKENFISIKTSGSTGLPKTIRLSKNKMIFSYTILLIKYLFLFKI